MSRGTLAVAANILLMTLAFVIYAPIERLFHVGRGDSKK